MFYLIQFAFINQTCFASENISIKEPIDCESSLKGTSFENNITDYFVSAYTRLAHVQHFVADNASLFESSDNRFNGYITTLDKLRVQSTCLMAKSDKYSVKLQEAYISGVYAAYVKELILLSSNLFTLSTISKRIAQCDDDRDCTEFNQSSYEKRKEEALARSGTITKSLADTWIFINDDE